VGKKEITGYQKAWGNLGVEEELNEVSTHAKKMKNLQKKNKR
jgi:hypothetical protein